MVIEIIGLPTLTVQGGPAPLGPISRRYDPVQDGRDQIESPTINRSFTPTQARDAAMVQAGKVAQLIDPQVEKKAAKIERVRGESTKLENFIGNLYESWAADHMKTWKAAAQRIQRRLMNSIPKM